MTESHELQDSAGPKQKKRSVTSLTLGWLAERLRRTELLKEKVQNGQYDVDSSKIAASIANEE